MPAKAQRNPAFKLLMGIAHPTFNDEFLLSGERTKLLTASESNNALIRGATQFLSSQYRSLDKVESPQLNYTRAEPLLHCDGLGDDKGSLDR